MNAIRNKVQLIGNLGNTPEVKTTKSGEKLVKFFVATNETYRNASGDKITETQWHNIIAWGKQAGIIEKYLDKGSEVVIQGRLVNKNYIDKNGNKKYTTEVHVNGLLMIGGKNRA